jgi:hypothetical protein
MSARTAGIALAVIVAAAVAGVWAYSEYRKRELHERVVALVSDTTARVRDVLSEDTGPPPSDFAQFVLKAEEQAMEVDRRLAELRAIGAAPNRALVDAAELYIVTGREVLRRMASSRRYRAEFNQSMQRLLGLMRAASRRSDAWVGQAVRAREQAERDYANYRGAIDSFGTLLDSLPAMQAKLAPPLDPALLLQEKLRIAAREHALSAARAAESEIREARRLAIRN